MSDPITSHLKSALERVIALAFTEGPFRTELRNLAKVFLDVTEGAGSETSASETAESPLPSIAGAETVAPPTSAPPLPQIPAPVVPAEPRLSIRDLDFDFKPYFGEPRQPTPPAPVIEVSHRAFAEPEDPQQIAARCQLKADAVRWRVKRSQLLASANGNGMDPDPERASLVDRAKQLQCFLWMIPEDSNLQRDPVAAEELAGCFEATGHTARIAGQALHLRERLRDEFLQTLELYAEAQSALRVAVRIFHPQADDDAQLSAFLWLKHATSTYQFYVRRHMKVDDPANPANWADVIRRVRALETGVLEVAKRSGQSKKLLGKLRHKVSLLLENPENHIDDWRILAETVDHLVLGGIPPSSLEIREPLLPLLDLIPQLEGPHPGFDRALREIERYQAGQPAPVIPAPPRKDPLIEEATKLVRGRSVLVIGGVPSPSSRQALKEALGLREVYWPETREHQSIAIFEAEVARPDVCLVLLAIRWSSHSFGDIKPWCDQYDKPLVRLPRGYNASQVAKEILDQASERLGRSPKGA